MNVTIEDLPVTRIAYLRYTGPYGPDSGMQLDDRPCFERYPAKMAFDDVSGAFGCDICIPVADLGQSS